MNAHRIGASTLIRRTRTAVVVAVMTLVLLPAAAGAAKPSSGACVVNVAGVTYDTVQGALDASPAGVKLRVRGTCLGPVVVTQDATITGESSEGPHATTLDAELTGPVLSIRPGATLIADRLRMIGGYNQATSGGGLHNDGTLVLIRSVVADNNSVQGGGLANFGDATIIRSTFDHNGQYQGGNIYNAGTLLVQDSLLTRGQGRFGQGLSNVGTATLVRTVVGDSDPALPFDGGGIENSGDVTLRDSKVTGNSSLFGGGILNTGTATLIRSKVTGNSALSGGGIINGPAFFAGSGSEHLILIGSEISGNNGDSGGGIYNKGQVTIDRHTRIGGNTAAAAGQGGGIFNDPGGTVTGIVNRTFTPPNVPDQCVGC